MSIWYRVTIGITDFFGVCYTVVIVICIRRINDAIIIIIFIFCIRLTIGVAIDINIETTIILTVKNNLTILPKVHIIEIVGFCPRLVYYLSGDIALIEL